MCRGTEKVLRGEVLKRYMGRRYRKSMTVRGTKLGFLDGSERKDSPDGINGHISMANLEVFVCICNWRRMDNARSICLIHVTHE